MVIVMSCVVRPEGVFYRPRLLAGDAALPCWNWIDGLDLCYYQFLARS